MPEELSDDANALDLEKRRLECEKLRAEIAQISLSWWKRPGYVGSMAPILIAAFGVLSAWATGFFDTQRSTLSAEIKTLELERSGLQGRVDDLTRASDEIQGTIDKAYLRLKMASADARYALGHMRAVGPPLSDSERAKVAASLGAVPQDVSKLINRLLEGEKIAAEIVPITEEELQGLEKRLETIPASGWATELVPEIGPTPALRAPDGRIYNPADGKFYKRMEDLERRENR